MPLRGGGWGGGGRKVWSPSLLDLILIKNKLHAGWNLKWQR